MPEELIENRAVPGARYTAPGGLVRILTGRRIVFSSLKPSPMIMADKA
jgi:hypothetical protein